MNEQLITRIKQCANLPSLPAIAVQVLELAQSDRADISEIARVICKDPALSGKILRTVNSSFYGTSQKISTVSHALVILGLQSVKILVLGFTLVPALNKNTARGFKHLDYWKRSVYAATAARLIAQKVGVLQAEEVFLAALLKDIGMLVLSQALGDEYGEICGGAANHLDLLAAEQAKLGLTHADVTEIMAEYWRLPPVLAIPMTHHHRSAAVKDPVLRKLTEVVYLAGRCADVFMDEKPAASIAAAREFALRTYGIGDQDCDTMLEEIGTVTKEVAPLFEINIGEGASFESILKKANETLVDLTLQTQAQSVELQAQNQQLKKQATTDGLTGLFNRAYLDQQLPALFASAVEQKRPLSILMLDMDHFKKVNDQHGHNAGDAVLSYVAKLLKAAGRPTDLAARYGGEEMMLVLLGASREIGSRRAETVCRALAARPVQIAPGKLLPVTASIGVACYEEGGTINDCGKLLRCTDLALYAAKSAGRNCVRVFSDTSSGTVAAAA